MREKALAVADITLAGVKVLVGLFLAGTVLACYLSAFAQGVLCGLRWWWGL